ncbi:MAG TPA: RNA polymerase sigma factor [Solirubrobacteraceae bacterium]|nr:RNA polymerase sigma factor [Solirubrobacteraceae bacterium]
MTAFPPHHVVRDEVLARRAAAGDEDAFAVLVSRHHPRIERYCRSIVRHDEDGSDAAQNAMAKAMLALRNGAGPDQAVRAWLYRIAHNEAISLLRRRRDEPELSDRMPTQGDSLTDTVELRDDVARLMDAVRHLPPGMRSAFLLRELTGLDHRTIGQVLGISQGASRQAVCEARQSLRRATSAHVMHWRRPPALRS